MAELRAAVASLTQQLATAQANKAEWQRLATDAQEKATVAFNRAGAAEARLTAQDAEIARLQSALDQQLTISGDYWQVIETQRQELVKLRGE